MYYAETFKLIKFFIRGISNAKNQSLLKDMIIAALSSVNLKEITADSDVFIRLSYFGRYATLARALLKDEPILPPDEAVSALDVSSESTIQESISCLAL